MTPRSQYSPSKSCLKPLDRKDYVESGNKRVFFDEILIKEYPVILGDNPAVSSGAPVSIGWKSSNESVVDLDFYEYCRIPERRPRKKMILSVRRRANTLLSSGYSLEQIANATLEVEKTKQLRAESLRSAGWSDPWALLSGAVETTGTALKRADVFGVGIVVGAGAAVGIAAGNAAVQGVNTVGRVTTDVVGNSTRMLVNGVQSSSRAVTNTGKNLVVKPVGKVVSSTGKAVTTGVTTTGKVIGTGITTTARGIGSVVQASGRALTSIVTPASLSPPRSNSPKSEEKPKKVKRRTSFSMGSKKDDDKQQVTSQ